MDYSYNNVTTMYFTLNIKHYYKTQLTFLHFQVQVTSFVVKSYHSSVFLFTY